ncbi:ComEC/Rec2 family competence protein, partial [Luedemannella flava]|uniref:ComEC/Rec2 family competence protein n=1 Tax=Luedemannella flava TaxID=349316 RepID=UPI0031E30A42
MTHRDPPDLRLFGLAGGAWLAAVAVVPASAATAVATAVVAALLAAGVGVAFAVLARRDPGRWAVGVLGALVGVLLGVVCSGAAVAARTSARDAPLLAGLVADGAEVSAWVVVSDDPKRLVSVAGPPTYLVRGTLERVGGVDLDARVVVLATDVGWASLLPGQRVRTVARLAEPRPGDLTAAVLRVRGAPEHLGEPPWAQRAAGRLRAGLQDAAQPLPDEPGGLLPGLVIGDTSRLDQALAEDFRATGLTHLVAVSGANVAIILAVVLAVCRRCRAGPWVCVAVCALVLVGFVILARPSPSVLRAAAMGAVGLLALGTGRRRAAAPTLAAAVFVLVLVDPDLARDPGFALSALATGGLILLAPRWRDALAARRVPGVLA